MEKTMIEEDKNPTANFILAKYLPNPTARIYFLSVTRHLVL